MATIDERTGLETLPTETCWELLRAGEIARLAVVVAPDPTSSR